MLKHRKVSKYYERGCSYETIFCFTDIIKTVSNLPVTKRNVLKLSAIFFDPLGLISPIVLLIKETCALKCT